MEKLNAAGGRWSGWKQAILAISAIVAGGAFDEVGAATMQRVLPPTELFHHRQLAISAIDAVAHRPDAASDGDAVHIPVQSVVRDQHGLGTHLSGSQWSQEQQLPKIGNDPSGAIVKGDLVDLHQQMAPGGAAQVLDHDGHGNRTPRLDEALPILDKGDTDHNAARPHAFVEVGDRDLVGIGREFIGLGGLPVGELRNPDRISGSDDRGSGQIGAASSIDEGEDYQYDTDTTYKNPPQGIDCPICRALGRIPLSAQIAVELLLAILTWPLYRVSERFVDKSLTVGEVRGMGLVLLAAGMLFSYIAFWAWTGVCLLA